jgi:hypothetical protein
LDVVEFFVGIIFPPIDAGHDEGVVFLVEEVEHADLLVFDELLFGGFGGRGEEGVISALLEGSDFA